MSKRNDRVASLLHREVAELLHRRLKDPRIEGLTITRVEVSPDLHYAWTYVDFVSRSGNMDEALAALSRASGFIRNEVRQSLRMRYTPEFVFRSDTGLEHSERIHRLLAELRDRGELPSAEPGGDAPSGQPAASPEPPGSSEEPDES